MQHAGIISGIFSSHSYRTASINKALVIRISVSTILDCASWFTAQHLNKAPFQVCIETLYGSIQGK